MKCFVTGAAGYIGNALTHRLISEGHEVIGLIHRRHPVKPNPDATYITADIIQPDSYYAFLKDIDVVFHCSAVVQDYGASKLFTTVNVEGTKYLAQACITHNISRFIYLGHIHYEIDTRSDYTITKYNAEQYLTTLFKEKKFPVIIIRPGNVYGPGATTWVIRPLKSILTNHIALIDDGKGIFHHTYIDNLLDALLLASTTSNLLGMSIDITDGDNTIHWKQYFNELADVIGKKPIIKKLTRNQAALLGKLMILRYNIFRLEPWITPYAVDILTNTTPVSIIKAQKLLGYTPKINYPTAMEIIRTWIQQEYSLKK